jgi:hypothetical protein
MFCNIDEHIEHSSRPVMPEPTLPSTDGMMDYGVDLFDVAVLRGTDLIPGMDIYRYVYMRISESIHGYYFNGMILNFI